MFDDLAALLDADERRADGRASVAELREQHPWLGVAVDLARREGAWHWELEFAPRFADGGFDLQVGNPPWVKMEWEEDVELAEESPALAVASQSAKSASKLRTSIKTSANVRRHLLAELARFDGLTGLLGSSVLHPALIGLQSNLYLSFIETVWRHGSQGSVQSLIHQEIFLTDPSGRRFRESYYTRVRTRAHFRNELRLFEDVKNNTSFCVSVYGEPSPEDRVRPGWLAACDFHSGWVVRARRLG